MKGCLSPITKQRFKSSGGLSKGIAQKTGANLESANAGRDWRRDGARTRRRDACATGGAQMGGATYLAFKRNSGRVFIIDMLTEDDIKSALKAVKYPGFSRDIISF